LKHSIYIRSNYTQFPTFLKRLEIMRATVVPSLLAQDGEFDVQVQVENSDHAKIIAAYTPFRPVLQFEFDGYDIQTRLDNDDIVSPGYVKAIESFYDGTPRVVTFDIEKLLWDTGEIYSYNRPYHAERCSMFSSLLCPPEGVNIFSRTHGALGELATVSVIEKGTCFLVVHGTNKLTKIMSDETSVNPVKD